MPYSYDHFGKKASFDDQQAIVVEAVVNDFISQFRKNVHLEIEKEELEEKLKAKESELQELQKIIDASISNLDPDSK